MIKTDADPLRQIHLAPTAQTINAVWTMQTQTTLCQSFGCTPIDVNNCCADPGWLSPQNQLYSHNFYRRSTSTMAAGN